MTTLFKYLTLVNIDRAFDIFKRYYPCIWKVKSHISGVDFLWLT